MTGGSKGIGHGIAERLLAPAIGSRPPTAAARSRPGCSACSATSPIRAQVEAAFTQVESSSARSRSWSPTPGSPGTRLLMRMSDEDWDAVIATNLTGAFRVARRAARPMMRARFGRIIFISSVVGQLGSAGQVNYAASKSGLVGLARSLARELGSRGITANVVAPGFIETDMTAELGEELVKNTPSRSRSAGWARSTTSPGRSSSWPATRPATSPAR